MKKKNRRWSREVYWIWSNRKFDCFHARSPAYIFVDDDDDEVFSENEIMFLQFPDFPKRRTETEEKKASPTFVDIWRRLNAKAKKTFGVEISVFCS